KTGPVVLGRLAPLELRLASGLELLGTAETAIGLSLRQEAIRACRVAREALALEVGPVGAADVRPLVPVEADPSEPLEDRLDRLGRRALAMGVLDPKDEGPAVVAGEEVVEERRARAADVKVARGARREAHANRSTHGRSSNLGKSDAPRGLAR